MRLTWIDVINADVGCTIQQIKPDGTPLSEPRVITHVGKPYEQKVGRKVFQQEVPKPLLCRPVSWETPAGKPVTITLQEGHLGWLIVHPAGTVHPRGALNSSRTEQRLPSNSSADFAQGGIPAGDCA